MVARARPVRRPPALRFGGPVVSAGSYLLGRRPSWWPPGGPRLQPAPSCAPACCRAGRRAGTAGRDGRRGRPADLAAEVLGTFGLLYAWALLRARCPGDRLAPSACARRVRRGRGATRAAAATRPLGPRWRPIVGMRRDRRVRLGPDGQARAGPGIFNFDSLWYHMPFSADIAQAHSITGMHHAETVFINWFYPQNSELLHAVGILLDRPRHARPLHQLRLAGGRLPRCLVHRPALRARHLAVLAAAIVSVPHAGRPRAWRRENDLTAAALVLAGDRDPGQGLERPARSSSQKASLCAENCERVAEWLAVAAAGLAVGLAAGTQVTVFAMAGGAQLAVIVLAPTGKRWRAARLVVRRRPASAAATGTCAT